MGLNALLMRRYMHQYDVKHEHFAGFAVNAHKNGANNPNAMFRSPIKAETYLRAGMIADPINLMDSSPVCDGAACLVLAPADHYRSKAKAHILASAVATDSLAIHDRRDPLTLDAVALSSQKAYAAGAASRRPTSTCSRSTTRSPSWPRCRWRRRASRPRGRGVCLAVDGEIGIDGRLPISTMGGLKARGHPVGATGVYQVVEVVAQLTGQAGKNQVQGARIGMAQNIGGSGATVITHILGGV